MSEETKPRIVKSHDINLDSDYVNWIHDVKQRYISTQIKAAVKVNTERLYFNWQLGRDLVERKAEEKWGKGIVEQLSLDLQDEFPDATGFSARNLWNMKKWYLFYSGNENFSELAHHMEERLDMKGLKLQQVGMEIDEKQKLHQLGAEMEFPYDLGFVSLPAGYDEKELKDALEQNITRFLLELGSGFAFVGRQKEIIYLRFVHEMSFEEISEIMEINIQSARNLLTRSMEKLRKEVSSTTILFFIYMISI